MNHDVPSRRNLRPVAPQNFADAAANAVPHHRAAQGFLDADAEAADAVRPRRSCGRSAARSLAGHQSRRKRCCERKKLRIEGSSGVDRAPYTASYSTRFNRRTARGKPCRGPSESLDGRETMASLFAASRQNFAASRGLHARAKAVRFMAAAHFRLKRAFRQRTLPLGPCKWDRVKTCSVVEAAEDGQGWVRTSRKSAMRVLQEPACQLRGAGRREGSTRHRG